ncbi:hypothetical protein QR680_006253 [Steinernema hermaphroditum]|uniref:Uncharacterized protein n=1 Tax=Steinernema hermaphroditum TaxID=289476 RepID=A0AA39HUT6_9BILA|nr:hypothetical protein QR680_006253 [Steinernema hermaphroditum]
MDLESVEIVFAQKLACGEPPVRKRALNQLRLWIETQSKADAGFNEESLMRLCKGLHYVFWMQDKPLLQEELADRISNLLKSFHTDAQSQKYVRCLFVALSNQWPSMDRWRMDKFLMLFRRILRATFARMRELKWTSAESDRYFEVLRATFISVESKVLDSLKYHFASIFLDELDEAGGVPNDVATKYISAFAHALAEKNSGYLFDSFIDEIFLTILNEKTATVIARDDEEEQEMIGEKPEGGFDIDYAHFAKLFFDLGKSPEVNSKRRQRLYKLSEQFERAAADKDPFPHIEKKDKEYEPVKRQMRRKKKRSSGPAKKIKKKARKGKSQQAVLA